MKSPSSPGGRRRGFSRRAFLQGGAAGAVTTGLLPGSLETAEAASLDVVGPGAVPIALRVNGAARTLELEPRVTLLEALRHELEVTGAKNVCDRATCGACTVLLDGQPAYACTVLAIDAQGREITTVEGLGDPERLSPVQQAFVDNDAQQCGYCTPGFVVACHALLERRPDPTDAEIDEALSGNLCRCGTYVGIRQAVRQVAGKGD